MDILNQSWELSYKLNSILEEDNSEYELEFLPTPDGSIEIYWESDNGDTYAVLYYDSKLGIYSLNHLLESNDNRDHIIHNILLKYNRLLVHNHSFFSYERNRDGFILH